RQCRALPLTSASFQGALCLLRYRGDVKSRLEQGENPLSDPEARRDLLDLLDAARDELGADLDDVLRRAARGETDNLAAFARCYLGRHVCDRMPPLCDWLQSLGIPARLSNPGLVAEVAWAVQQIADRCSPFLPVPGLAVLTDAVWILINHWHQRGRLRSR